jgi:hypothetical protein
MKTITSVLALLASLQLAPALAETSQQDEVVTATASGPNESNACSTSMGKAYSLCMARGFFNVTGVKCSCTQRGATSALTWECTGIATCKK